MADTLTGDRDVDREVLLATGIATN